MPPTNEATLADLLPQAEALDRIGETLGMLGLESARGVIQEQRKVVQGLWRRGEAWVSDTRVGGKVPALRACVTNVDSREADVDALVAAARAAVTPPSEPPRSG